MEKKRAWWPKKLKVKKRTPTLSREEKQYFLLLVVTSHLQHCLVKEKKFKDSE